MNKLWLKLVGKSIENSIYMKVLELGYNSGEKGVSFDNVVKKLNIDLSNSDFEINLVVWFYTNFYHEKYEPKILGLVTATATHSYLNKRTYRDLKQHNDEESYIKGDALNKYIDFLELQRTRKASINATIISLISVIIAISSIIIPRIFPNDKKPMQNIYNSYYGDEATEHKNKDTLNIESTKKNMIKSENDTSD